MAPRSIAELVQAAIDQRRAAVIEGRDLEHEQFKVFAHERDAIRNTPLIAESSKHISADRTRICGMLIVVVGGSAMRRRRRR